ncbi:tyrosine-type recombinase/integrase [Lysobacter niastensis]|uniref:Tyrosine-type recombinase/integrase n=2 Tax=Lysobacter niastensis TaxID=380629 RepID=A0ABS0BD12_9GAMM|nr:tyrosine-type recombinase/integrase [Lysobacter niastensis]
METYFRTHLTGKGSEKVARLTYGRHAGKFGTRLLSALTTDDLQRWHRDIATKPPTKRGKAMPFDPSDPVQVRARRASANRILSSVKAALNHAWVNDRLPPEQPVFWAKVKPFAVGDGPPPRMLERGEVKRLLDVASADLRNLLMGAFMTGARLSEARHMQVRDFDLRHKTIRIFQAKTGKTLLQPLTTEGEEFFIRMTKGRAPQEMIFLKDNGRPWGQSDADKPMRVAAKAADLEGVTFKTTRATYGKMLLLAARDIELVAKALGHSDSRVTRTHYAQYLPSEVARAVAQLPRLGITPVR